MDAKQTLKAAFERLRTVAVEAAAVRSESNADEVKSFNSKTRDAVAHFFATASIVSVGDAITGAMLKPLVKATGDSLKVRLSEVRKIAKNHPRWSELASAWSEPEHAFQDGEVRQALKDVTKPSDPLALISKAVRTAMDCGATEDDVLEAVTVAVKQYRVEVEFLAESSESSEAQQKVA